MTELYSTILLDQFNDTAYHLVERSVSAMGVTSKFFSYMLFRVGGSAALTLERRVTSCPYGMREFACDECIHVCALNGNGTVRAAGIS